MVIALCLFSSIQSMLKHRPLKSILYLQQQKQLFLSSPLRFDDWIDTRRGSIISEVDKNKKVLDRLQKIEEILSHYKKEQGEYYQSLSGFLEEIVKVKKLTNLLLLEVIKDHGSLEKTAFDAIEENNEELFRFLLPLIQNVSYRCAGMTFLHKAVELGRTNFVDILLRDERINKSFICNDRTARELAVSTKNKEIVDIFDEHGIMK
jgi:hypothetical protein